MLAVLIFSSIYLLLFGLTDLLYYQFHIKADLTRKIAHLLSGIIALFFPMYFSQLWQVALLCFSFLILLFVSERMQWFRSITSVQRTSHGSWLFSLAIFCCFYSMQLLNDAVFYYLPIWILSLSDSIASIVGTSFPIPQIKFGWSRKTLSGSLSFFLCTCLITYTFQLFTVIELILFSFVITLIEYISIKGLDNITIPFTTLFILYFCL